MKTLPIPKIAHVIKRIGLAVVAINWSKACDKFTHIKQLQYLLAVHHQHFGRAAEACFIGQSTLSSAIQNLEETLGCQLIERENRSLMFTDIGGSGGASAQDY